MKRMILGNQAVAYGALAAGVDVVTGYPGTPSSEVVSEILRFAGENDRAPYVEWSVNEKVAVEIAAAAGWSGRRAMATMKMSGVNVAADTILSTAYSGTSGGLVLYVADDPGAEAGMPEQDTRLFAQWAGLPVLETESPQQAYDICRFAFDFSETVALPVILRSVTSVSHVLAMVDADVSYAPQNGPFSFEREVRRFTKAGAAICLRQHRDLLDRLERAEAVIHDRRINRWVPGRGASAVISAGQVNRLAEECLHTAGNPSVLYLRSTYPLDRRAVAEVFARSNRIVILEELEPVVENMVRSEATLRGWVGEIVGKLDGTLPRAGRYTQGIVREGLERLTADSPDREVGSKAYGAAQENNDRDESDEPGAMRHPITFCAGCPHRGTYMALNRALTHTGLRKDKTIVTGDIGCTILGMNPPFDSCWTEVSMGSSVGFAQGFTRAGSDTPVVATIGDSTFFHAGIPPLVNAVQHGTDLLLIILDNGWTSMTGFQVNPGTEEELQPSGHRRVDLARVVRSLGADVVEEIRPFQQENAVETVSRLLTMTGVRVIISREECALTCRRREGAGRACAVDPEACTFCGACVRETGCPALMPEAVEKGGRKVMRIDAGLCTGCGLCASSCRFEAIHPVKERAHVV